MPSDINDNDADDGISERFWDAVNAFPEGLRDEAKRWLSEREAAHRIVKELQEKGLAALLPDDEGGARD